MNLNRTLKPLTLAALLLAAAAPAHAAESLSTRIAAGLGNAIAIQGNAAFQQIREDLRLELVETFEEWLPEAPAADTAASGASASGTASSDVQ